MKHNPQMKGKLKDRLFADKTKQAGYCCRPVGRLLLNIVRYRLESLCLLHP